MVLSDFLFIKKGAQKNGLKWLTSFLKSLSVGNKANNFFIVKTHLKYSSAQERKTVLIKCAGFLKK